VGDGDGEVVNRVLMSGIGASPMDAHQGGLDSGVGRLFD
jgi:hypothetical protein